MKRMTLKQRRLARHIPTSKTIKEAGEKAGYSYNAKNIYRENTKKHLKEIYSKEWIQDELERYKILAETDGDYKICIDAIVNLAKLLGYYTDTTPQTPLHITFSTEKDDAIRKRMNKKDLGKVLDNNENHKI